jgi:hypothetical protein
MLNTASALLECIIDATREDVAGNHVSNEAMTRNIITSVYLSTNDSISKLKQVNGSIGPSEFK